ncbi:MAG TPA: DNA-processing protein DprA [Candidatus Coprenecus pullistercoris]|nr:DNA-processing protein DprA [Candidatus Coprenecus pullistercoris]
MEYDETVYACAINRIFNYNCRDARIITEHFASPGELFSLTESELHGHIRRQEYIDAVTSPATLRDAAEEVRWAREHGIHIIYINDREYPARLRECPDAPTVLFLKGTSGLNPARAVAIVGTRKATSYGREQCRAIITRLAALSVKPAIISGLAYGIDICAHLTALECGLETIAVLPTGLDRIYPAAHRRHAIEILHHGGLVTDFPKGSSPQPVTFLRRNRIIAGMSDAVLLIESAAKGGGMITASLAQSYSREVFALPGRTTDPYSAGCNALIRDNAASIISDPSWPAKALGWEDADNETNKDRLQKIFDTSDYIKRNILLALAADSSVDRDIIIAKSGGDPAQVLPRLTEMEMDGLIRTDAHGNYSLTHR